MSNNSSVPISCDQGVSKEFTITIKTPVGDPLDLSDCSTRMQVRRTIEAPNPPFLDLSSRNGDIIIDGEAGKLTILINPGALSEIFCGVYDLILYDINGIAFMRVIKGSFIIDPTITRA